MSLIQSLMKRRQFLALSGMASASALTIGKLAAETGTEKAPASPAHGAPASNKPGTAKAGVLSDRYSHILSPIKIGNQVLKNRMIVSMSTPHFLQGPENFPSELMRDYYVNMARNGAARYRALFTKGGARSSLVRSLMTSATGWSSPCGPTR